MLKRDISTVNVLIAAASGMIGSGWLFAPFIGAKIAGANSLISWIIAAIFMLFIALPLCELGTIYPIAGGIEILKFPFDVVCILPFSIIMLHLSQRYLINETEANLLVAEN